MLLAKLFHNFTSPKFDKKSVGIFGLVFAFYIGTGPVYWIPNLNLFFVEILKTFSYLFIVLFPFVDGAIYSRLIFPGGKVPFLAMGAFFLLSLPGALTGAKEESLYQLQNTIQIILFVHACGFLIHKKLIKPVVYLSVKIFSSFCVLSFILMVVVPDYVNPLNEQLGISQTGFGGSRTGWSPAIALYLPWVYSGSLFFWITATLFGLVMFSNQVLVAGRTGMVGTLLPFLAWGFVSKSMKIFLFMLLGTLSFFIYAFQNIEKLRLGKGGFGSRDALDELSTGRWDQYIAALNYIVDNPLLGQGAGNVLYYGHDGQILTIHNSILKAAAEGGIPYALAIIFLFVLVIIRGMRGFSRGDSFILPALLTVVAGIVASMFEPGFMFGSFNNACFWWVCFSICISGARVKYYSLSH